MTIAISEPIHDQLRESLSGVYCFIFEQALCPAFVNCEEGTKPPAKEQEADCNLTLADPKGLQHGQSCLASSPHG